MNDDIVIDVKNISKKYTIATDYQPDTLREKIVELAKYPLKVLKGDHQKPKTKEYWALKDVSFQVKRGEVLGIIGKNGAGKSTLLKILSRTTEPTSGTIQMKGKVASLLEVGTGFNPELTGRENIYLNGAIIGMSKKEINSKFNEIVEFAGIGEFLDTPVKRYSSGMYVRLAFAVAAHLDFDILLLDEVLSVGDIEFKKTSYKKMEEIINSNKSIVYVSHDMNSIIKMCHRAIMLDSGEVISSGRPSDIINTYSSVTQLKHIKRGIVRNIKVNYKDNLLISAEYNHDKPLPLPCLGFVVKDSKGITLFGSNPLRDKIFSSNIKPKKSGRVEVSVLHPNLNSGEYTISLWFGDGIKDYYAEENVVSFKVVSGDFADNLGSIYPKCEWRFK